MKKILSIASLAFFVLSACSSVPPKAPVAGTAKQPVAQQPASIDEGEAEVPLSRYGNNMKCNLLKSTERQQECEAEVNETIGRMLESEIMSSYDASRCSELSGELATSCQERLTETGVKGPVSAEEIVLFNEITRGAVSEDPENPTMTYDSARCSELKAVGYKEYCEKRVSQRADQDKMMQIIQANDKAGCDQLTTESIKNDCKSFFGEEMTAEVPIPEENQ